MSALKPAHKMPPLAADHDAEQAATPAVRPALVARAPGAVPTATPAEPAALAALAGELARLGDALATGRAQVHEAQASLQLMLPPDLAPEQFGALALGALADAQHAPTEIERGFAQLYLHLDGLRLSLTALATHHGRFGAVVDLMAAASHLLEPATFALAHRLIVGHVSEGLQVLADLQVALADMPSMPAPRARLKGRGLN